MIAERIVSGFLALVALAVVAVSIVFLGFQQGQLFAAVVFAVPGLTGLYVCLKDIRQSYLLEGYGAGVRDGYREALEDALGRAKAERELAQASPTLRRFFAAVDDLDPNERRAA